jgi:antitoxin PrlF
MPIATMTSKGQITIPSKVRKALGLKPGARIDFFQIEDGEYALRARNGSIMDMRGCLANSGPAISIKEMNHLVLERAAALDEATKSGAFEDRPSGETA